MRVISQDGMVDIPYDTTALSVDCYNSTILTKLPGYDKMIIIAQYSSKEKALKAMEMMREHYARLSALQTLLSGKAEQCVTKSVNDFIDMFTFQFPSDTAGLEDRRNIKR